VHFTVIIKEKEDRDKEGVPGRGEAATARVS
jgi:hypothetical protein